MSGLRSTTWREKDTGSQPNGKELQRSAHPAEHCDDLSVREAIDLATEHGVDGQVISAINIPTPVIRSG